MSDSVDHPKHYTSHPSGVEGGRQMRRISLLDHGYVQFVESWGSDERVIESARMSTSKGFEGWGPFKRCRSCGDAFDAPERDCPKPNGKEPYVDCGRGGHYFEHVPGDEKLLRYLYTNAHATPFEFSGLTIEVQAPIFVFREWHRHRTQSYNEASARYAPLPDINYVPTVERLLFGGGHVTKQAGTASGAESLTPENAARYQKQLAKAYEQDQEFYELALSIGVPKELARVHLPVGRYSRMRASTDLRNWLAFLTLRMSPNAQWEIRQYANAVGSLIAESFPRTWELFSGGRQ